MMTKQEIAIAVNPEVQQPEVQQIYLQTHGNAKLVFEDGSIIVGLFTKTNDSDKLGEENKYTFVENVNKNKKNHKEYITIIDAQLLKSIEYPSYTDAKNLI
jgi:hypothetical protein